MIATTTNYRIRYDDTTSTEYTGIYTRTYGSQTSYRSGYSIGYYNEPVPLSLKLQMKLWAEERMFKAYKLRQLHPIKYPKLIKPIGYRPIRLRAVRLNNNAWAI